MRHLILSLCTMVALTAARASDDAPVTHAAATQGCPAIPSSISLSEDCRACEYFHVSSLCPVEYYHITIYDRTGARVYSTYDMTQDWDGSLDHTYLPVGCYTYEILYRISPADPLQIHQGTLVFLH